MAKKNRPCALSSNIGKPLVKQDFGHEHHGRKESKSYGLAEPLGNHGWNQGLSRSIKWQEKQTRGRRRRTMESPGAPSKNLGKTRFSHMVAQAETVICIGCICATSKILRFNENLQKPLVEQGFEHEHQITEVPNKNPGVFI